ncbi:MAG: hypothetical protein OEX82_04350 [Nitrosomonas sp.]|nr:hypothetical protein [Nitrosomonas sp.]
MLDSLNQKSASFFSFREDFNYLSYLETKRHLDKIELKLDASVDRLIGHTQNDLACLSAEASAGFEAIDVALNGVIGELSEAKQGTEYVCIQLDDIKRSDVGSIALFEWGFTEAITQLNAMNLNISELIKISKTPDQTWAFEQFDRSRDFLLNCGLIENSLDYINRAIEGYGNHPGIHDEARFYMLRGSIYLGNLDHIETRFVDIIKARSDFNLAARYSKEVDKALHAKALGLVGWTHYCCGEMEEATHWFGAAVAVDSNQADIHFHYSKALMQNNRTEDGIKEFGLALRLNSEYGKRAAGDSDLMRHKNRVIEEIECYRCELISDLKVDFQNIALRSRLDNLHKTGQILCSAIELEAYSKLDVLEKNLPSLTVEALEALHRRLLPQLLRLAQDELTSKYQLLKSVRIQKVESFLNEKYAQKSYLVPYKYLIFVPFLLLIWGFFELSDTWWHYLILLTVSMRILSWVAIYVMELPKKQKEMKYAKKKSEMKRLLTPVFETEADKLYKSEYEHLSRLLSTQARNGLPT